MPMKYPEEFIIQTVQQHEAGVSKYNYSSSSDADELFTLNPWTFLLSVLLM